jgi:hypothetical protein
VYQHAVTIAGLENELAEIIQYVIDREFSSWAELMIRREELLAALTKEQETVIKTKKEMKHKFDAVDTYLNDYAKVCLLPR